MPGRQRTDDGETADIFAAAAAEKGLEANSTRAGAGGAVAAPGAAEEREEGESGGRGDLFSLLGRRTVWLFLRSGGGGVGDSGTVPAVSDGLRHEIIQEAPEVD